MHGSCGGPVSRDNCPVLEEVIGGRSDGASAGKAAKGDEF